MIILAGIITLTLVALLFWSEFRSFVIYKIAPAYARNANFICLRHSAVEVYILGTIHGEHLTTSDYGLAHLKAIITCLHPEVLLVESRPEEIAQGRWGDGPIEMPYAALTGRALGIHVDGMDWWDLSGETCDAPMKKEMIKSLSGDIIYLNDLKMSMR